MSIEIKIDRMLDEFEDAVDSYVSPGSKPEFQVGRATGLQKALELLEDDMVPYQSELFDALRSDLEEV